MKKIFTTISAVMVTVCILAQAPQKMSYQGVIRNSSNVLVTSSPVGMRVSILQGSTTGTPVYVETQTPTTNANGLVTIEIGGGAQVTGTFAGIDWSTGIYFIKTETDPTGGTSYSITGTTQLLSVPYALYSKTSESSTGAVTITGNQTITGIKTFSNDLFVNGLTIGNGNNAISSNTAIGYSALYSNTTGYRNTAIGHAALYSNTTGYRNTANGYHTLFNNITGYDNTANGYLALYSNTTGMGNTANGVSALRLNTTGDYNTAIGYGALYSNTTGSYNIANGINALLYNTSGYSNVAIGVNALSSSTTHHNQVAVGDSALFHSEADENTAIGSKALFSNTAGYGNTATGTDALYSNTTGNFNTANGISALRYNTTGYGNTANGYYSLSSNTIGNYNTASGIEALTSNTTGNSNTADGRWALNNNTTGSHNAANGYCALFSNTTGSQNTAMGMYSSYKLQNSNNNTSVGFSAGDYQTFEAGTFLGASAFPGISGISNCMALGYNARVSASNRVVIGNSLVTSIGGYAGWTDFSDQRYKTAIQENVKGLEFIMKLRPVTYQLDINKLAADLKEDQNRDAGDKVEMGSSSSKDAESRNEKSRIVYTGFLAQEVEAAAQSIGYEFSGVEAPKNENDFYGLRYSEFVVPLVKAVQEQQKMIDELKKEIEVLKKK
jgi:hypothetical protein